MKPTVEQMLEAAQLALRNLVVPAVTDQWAASALRSIDVILSHLQARTPVEGPMLFEDNEDIATSIAGAAAALTLPRETVDAITSFTAEVSETRHGYPPVGTLLDLNIRGRTLVDELLLACHAQREHAQARQLHESLRAYLTRHGTREQPFFFPVYVGRPV